MDVWSILIVVFLFQGFFVLFSILISKKRRQRQGNIYLVFLVCAFLWILVEFFLVRNKIDPGIDIVFGTRYGFWLVIGPLFLFYVRRIQVKKWQFKIQELLHFVPFLVFFFILPITIDGILNKRQIDYGMLSVFDHREKVISPIQYFYSYVFVFQFVHFGIYTMYSLRQILDYRKLVKKEYDKVQEKFRWLTILLASLVFILIFTSVFLLFLLKSDIYRRHMDYLYVIPIGFLFYLIGYFLIDVDWNKVEIKHVKYSNSTLKVHTIAHHISELDNLLKRDMIFLNPKIRLDDLAKRLGMSKHHLSQLINQHYRLSFFDLINKHRVENAKELIMEDPDRLLIDVAFDSGFNNKTSFVNAFKKFANKTPSEFRQISQGS